MKMINVISGSVVACAMVFSADSAFAAAATPMIAFMNPTKAQINVAKAQVRADVKANPTIYGGKGTKINISYSAGTPTIGPDRSHTRPEPNVTVIGKPGQFGMANDNKGAFTISVMGQGTKDVSVQQDGTWQRLLTGVGPQGGVVKQ